jgi:hypothetical protein
MDGGKLEKDRAVQFKRIVKQNKRRISSCNRQQAVTSSDATLQAHLRCPARVSAPEFSSSASVWSSNVTQEYVSRETSDITLGSADLSTLDSLDTAPFTIPNPTATAQNTSAVSSNQRQVTLASGMTKDAWLHQ